MKNQIKTRYQEDLRALERIYKLSREDEDGEEGTEEVFGDEQTHGSLIEAVKAIARKESAPFISKKITKILNAERPDLGHVERATVISTLRRLAKQSDSGIVLVTPGKGKSPSVFQTTAQGGVNG